MQKVFIINRGGHNHSDAERFGELVYLSEGVVNRYAITEMYREFVQILKTSNEEDYILLTGLSVMSSLACAIFSRMHGRLNLLLYRATRTPGEQGSYVERTIMIDELL